MSMKFQGPASGGNPVVRWVGNFSLVNRVSGQGLIVASENGLTFGNANDNLPVNFLGTGTVTVNGLIAANRTLAVTGPSGGELVSLKGAAAGSANIAYLTFRDSNNIRTGYLGDADSRDQNIYLSSDNGSIVFAPNGGTGGAQMVVSAALYSFGDTTNNPTFNFLGTGSGSVNGPWTFNPGGGIPITANGPVGNWTTFVSGANAGSASFGLLVEAGTSASDTAFYVLNRAATISFFRIFGDGSTWIGNNGTYPPLSITSSITQINSNQGQALAVSSTAPPYIAFQRNGTSFGYIGDRNALSSGTIGDIAIRGQAGLALVINAGTEALYISSSNVSLFKGTVQAQDAGGSAWTLGWLGTPVNQVSGNYTLGLSDRGKEIQQVGVAGSTITVPANVFSAGDVVTITALNSTNNYTIAPGGGMTMYWAGNGTTNGSRTLTSVGIATIQFQSTNACLITGAGLS